MNECIADYTPTFKSPVTSDAWGRVALLVRALVAYLPAPDGAAADRILAGVTS